MRFLFHTLMLRYWQRHRARTALLLACVALGVAAWVATQVLMDSLDHARRGSTVPLADAAQLHVTNGDAGVPLSCIETLRQAPGVRAVRPLVIQHVFLPSREGTALLLGVEMPTARDPGLAPLVTLQDFQPAHFAQAALLGQNPVLLGKELARRITSPQFTVLVGGKPHTLTRAGVITEGHGPASVLTGHVLVMPYLQAARLTGRPDLVSRFDVQLQPGAIPERVITHLRDALQGQAEVWTAAAHDGYMGEMLAGTVLAFSLCGLGAQIVGLFLLYNAFSVCVAERHYELGILRAVGATRGQLRWLFLAEAFLLGVMGVSVGIPLGLGLAWLGLGPMQAIVSDVFFPLPDVALRCTAATMLSGGLVGLGTTLLAALLPVLRAGAVAPIDILRQAAPRPRPWLLAVQLLGCLVLFMLGMTLIFFRTYLPAQVGAAGGLMSVILGVLLLFPLLAYLAARGLRLVLRPWLPITLRLGLDNLLRAPGRTGLVVSAVACGVALLLQTAGTISSHEAGIREWVDNSIAGDLFITAGGPLSASGRAVPLPEALATDIQTTLPGAIAVPLRFRYLPYHGAQRSGRILLVSLDTAAYCAANRERQPPLPFLKGYEELRDQPGTALISENFAALYGVGPGQTIQLPGAGVAVTLRVTGVVPDFSCNRGTVLVDRTRWKTAFNLDLVDVFSTYLPAGSPREAARARAQESAWAATHAVVVLPREELRGHVLSMVERLFGLAYAQELVLAIVAVMGVVTALLISVLQRRRELGLLRAIGATRGQVFRSVVAEAVLMGLFGIALGTLAGLPLTWYVLRVILFEETGFVFPFRFPLYMVAIVSAITLATTALAGLGPAWHAVRAEVAAGIAYE